jgi:hypothetical protein
MESKHFTWIDHHKSAIDAYNDAVENGIGFRSMDVHVLEVGRAACELTWEYLFPGEELPLAVLLLGAYDVWRKKDLKAWEEQVMPFQYGIRMESSSVDTFPMTLLDSDYRVEGIIQIGNSILEYQKGQNEGLMKGAFKTEVHGYQAVCCNIGLVNFNSQSFSSVFDPEEDEIMIAFCYLGPSLDQWRISFYTEDPNIDVSVLAKKYGGGGHRGAAGCQVRNWKQVISNI